VTKTIPNRDDDDNSDVDEDGARDGQELVHQGKMQTMEPKSSELEFCSWPEGKCMV